MILFGRLESINGNTWVIGRYTVLVDAKTKIWGAPSVGDWVWAQAYHQQNGSFLAVMINLAWRGRR